MKKGLLIVLSGPSGVGKGTVRKAIIAKRKIRFTYSISMTTRAPRNKEVDGKDYYFVSHEEFDRNIELGNFLEYTSFVGNKYGTPKDKVDALRDQGKNVFLEIEINGATQVLNRLKQENDNRVISFFLKPPSLQDLENRIRKRRSETEDVIRERLNKGAAEMEMTDAYDHVILNDEIDRAAEEIISLIKAKQYEK